MSVSHDLERTATAAGAIAIEPVRHAGIQFEPFCPSYHQAVELIGRRWSGAILRVMLAGVTRFSDIAASVPGLSDRLLSERLKELESEGLLTRTVYPETPVRIEYRLTEKGEALAPVVEALSRWAETWHPVAAPPPDDCPPIDAERA